MREILERELIRLGLGHVLGEKEYYYPSTKFGQIKWVKDMQHLIEEWKSF